MKRLNKNHAFAYLTLTLLTVLVGVSYLYLANKPRPGNELPTTSNQVVSTKLAEKSTVAMKEYRYDDNSNHIEFQYPSDLSLEYSERIYKDFGLGQTVSLEISRVVDSEKNVCRIDAEIGKMYVDSKETLASSFENYMKVTSHINSSTARSITGDGVRGYDIGSWYFFPYSVDSEFDLMAGIDEGEYGSTASPENKNKCVDYGKQIIKSLKLHAPAASYDAVRESLKSVQLPVFILGAGQEGDKGGYTTVALSEGQYKYKNPNCGSAFCTFSLDLDSVKSVNFDGNDTQEVLVESSHFNGGNKPVESIVIFSNKNNNLTYIGEIPLEYQSHVYRVTIEKNQIAIGYVPTDSADQEQSRYVTEDTYVFKDGGFVLKQSR